MVNDSIANDTSLEKRSSKTNAPVAWRAGIAVLAGAAFVAPVMADQAPAGNELDEIVVTARKVEERLIDVPPISSSSTIPSGMPRATWGCTRV